MQPSIEAVFLSLSHKLTKAKNSENFHYKFNDTSIFEILVTFEIKTDIIYLIKCRYLQWVIFNMR